MEHLSKCDVDIGLIGYPVFISIINDVEFYLLYLQFPFFFFASFATSPSQLKKKKKLGAATKNASWI
jgi:uncharacterized membrane protein